MAKRYQRGNQRHKYKDRQYNGDEKRDKRTNNNLQKTTQKTKDWATIYHIVINKKKCDCDCYR
jgi:hypothetical protein